MRTRLAVLAAAAMILAGCTGGIGGSGPNPATPESSTTPGPQASPSAGVNCAIVEDIIADALTAVVPGEIEVAVASGECGDRPSATKHGVEDSFHATLTTGVLSESEIHAVVTTAAEVWALPEVQEVAANTPYLQINTGALTLILRDGFLPIPDDSAAILARLAASPDLTYTYYRVTPGFTIAPVPSSHVSLGSYVLMNAESLEGEGAHARIVEAWDDVRYLALEVAAQAQIGVRNDFAVPLNTGSPVPEDFLPVLQGLESLTSEEGIQNVRLIPEASGASASWARSVTLRVVTTGASGPAELSPEAEATLTSAWDAIFEWGTTPVVSVDPPLRTFGG